MVIAASCARVAFAQHDRAGVAGAAPSPSSCIRPCPRSTVGSSRAARARAAACSRRDRAGCARIELVRGERRAATGPGRPHGARRRRARPRTRSTCCTRICAHAVGVLHAVCATSSATLRSVSCPTPTSTGTGIAAIARATSSVSNGGEIGAGAAAANEHDRVDVELRELAAAPTRCAAPPPRPAPARRRARPATRTR